MKKLVCAIFASSVFAAGAVPAAAADLPLKEPLYTIYDWTGFYGGAHLGYAFGTASDSTVAPPGVPFSTQAVNLTGVAFGADIGYNFQLSPWFVLGLESDISITGITGSAISANAAGVAAITDTETNQWYGSTRGRFGVAPAWGWLLYATGGVAYTTVRSDETFQTSTFTSSFFTPRLGWTAGAGLEAAFDRRWPNWTARLEYLYSDYGTFSRTYTGIAGFTPATLTSHFFENVVRIGMNYRF